MNRKRSIGAAVGLTALLITSAAAQTPAGQSDGAVPTVTVPAGSPRKAQNTWRGGTLIGTPIFNDNRQRVATINDLLITDDGTVDKVVVLVTQPRKLVAVPFSQLRFAPRHSFGPPVGRRGRRSQLWSSVVRSDNRLFVVMLPGASRDALAGMETFRFGPSQ